MGLQRNGQDGTLLKWCMGNHLGGNRQGAILYFLEFIKGKKGGNDHRWRWTKCCDQTEANSLYKDLHFDKP